MDYHFSQLRALWISAGGTPKDADAMAAIAMAESHGRLAVHNARDPFGGSWCAWQINGVHPFFPQVLTHDPYYCALAAVYVRHRQGLNAWSTHSDGKYLAFLPYRSLHAMKARDHRRHLRYHGTRHMVHHRKPIADLAHGKAMNHFDMWFVLAAAFFALWRLEKASEIWEINGRKTSAIASQQTP